MPRRYRHSRFRWQEHAQYYDNLHDIYERRVAYAQRVIAEARQRLQYAPLALARRTGLPAGHATQIFNRSAAYRAALGRMIYYRRRLREDERRLVSIDNSRARWDWWHQANDWGHEGQAGPTPTTSM